MHTRNIDFKKESEETVKKIRGQLTYGSNNYNDKDHTDFQHGNAIRASVPIAALKNALHGHSPNPSVFAKLNSLAIKKYGYAQCGEQAQAAFIDLIEKDVYPVDFCVTTDGGHNLLVVGRDPTSDKDDISTWGEKAFICDPWANKVYLLSELEIMQQDTVCGKYNEEIYKRGTVPPHYLSGKLCVVQEIKNEDDVLAFKRNIKIDNDILDMFKSKITSKEQLLADTEKMQQDYSALLNSHLGSNQGAMPALSQIEECLNSLTGEQPEIIMRPKQKYQSMFNESNQKVSQSSPSHNQSQIQQVGIDVIQVLNGALTAEQYQNLSSEVRQLIAGNARDTRELMQDIGISFIQIQTFSIQVLRELLKESYAVARLVNEVHIPLDDLLKLNQALRTELLKESHAVARLVNEAHIPLDDLLQLNQAVRTELLKKSYDVARLVKKVNISFEKLSSLTVEQVRTVIHAPDSEKAQSILNPSSSSFKSGIG